VHPLPPTPPAETRCAYKYQSVPKYRTCHHLALPLGAGLCVGHAGAAQADPVLLLQAVTDKIERGDWDFEGWTIPDGLNDELSGQTIKNGNFGWTTFLTRPNFHGTTFTGETSFQLAIFNDGARFEDCVFEWTALFDRASFLGMPPNPGDAEPSTKVSFLGAIFKDEVFFMATTFRTATSFESVSFRSRAHFESTSFGDMTRFHTADLSRAEFRSIDEVARQDARQVKAERAAKGEAWPEVPDRLDLSQVQFAGARGLSEALFERVDWATYPREGPFFWEAGRQQTVTGDEQVVRSSLPSDAIGRLRWTLIGLLFTVAIAAGITAWISREIATGGVVVVLCTLTAAVVRMVRFDVWKNASTAESVCRALRRGYESRKDFELSNAMYYGEMEMRRHTGRLITRIVLWLYWLVAGYGGRFGRPLSWYLALVVICAIGYGLSGLRIQAVDETTMRSSADKPLKVELFKIDSIGKGNVDWERTVEGALYAVRHSLRTTLLQRDLTSLAVGPLGTLFETVETLLGPTLLVFLTLSIRRRFQQ
jgi:hypothetical protein